MRTRDGGRVGSDGPTEAEIDPEALDPSDPLSQPSRDPLYSQGNLDIIKAMEADLIAGRRKKETAKSKNAHNITARVRYRGSSLPKGKGVKRGPLVPMPKHKKLKHHLSLVIDQELFLWLRGEADALDQPLGRFIRYVMILYRRREIAKRVAFGNKSRKARGEFFNSVGGARRLTNMTKADLAETAKRWNIDTEK